MKKQNLLGCTAVCAIAVAGLPAPAQAQLKEEIIVTATKRAESAADIPIAVSALGEETLDELRVDVFTDYLVQLPGVTAGGTGPGLNTIYIRGLASTTPAISVAGVAGLAPNVAFYLDEQPLAHPGRNLDVYAADLERIEVLSGPQGTLFGASAQAGAVRMITNKPKIGVTEARSSMGTSFTKGGNMSSNLELVYNVPIGDSAAIRVVGYYDKQGGYIDNVPGEISARDSGRYRPAGTVRSNGVPVSEDRQGFQVPNDDNQGGDLSGVTFITGSNADLVEDNFNDAQYLGGRISGTVEINDDWSVTAGYIHQELDTEGLFYGDPGLGDWRVQSYEDSTLDDDFDNISWTVKGRLGMLEALYTGAYTDRKAQQRIDYTDYLYVGQYFPYYLCDYSVYNGPGRADDGSDGFVPEGTCYPPNTYQPVESNLTVQTHELRFYTPAEKRLRATAGGFFSDLALEEQVDFNYPSIQLVRYDDDIAGFPPNFRFPGGYRSDDEPFGPDTAFRNDTRRTDKQLGIFGEGTFELTDQFAITLGARWYDIEVDLEGSSNTSFCNWFSQEDRDSFGTHISDLYDGDGEYIFSRTCSTDPMIRGPYTLEDSLEEIQARIGDVQGQRVFNELRAPDKAEASGTIFKATGAWTPNDDLLFYATYSQGFRPGLLNRPGGAVNPAGTFTVPFALDTDEVDNFEFGWKTTLADNQLRFNGSAFFIDISKLQTTIFDPSIVNLFFSDNAANAEIKGVEGNFAYAPVNAEGLTITGAFSFLDSEITEVLTPTNDVRLGDELAFAPGFQGNLRIRYEWETGSGLTAHIMPQIVYSTSSFSDIITINRDQINGWTSVSLSAGIRKDNWRLEVYGDNLFNKAIELSRNYVYDRHRAAYGRPLSIGARASFNFE